MNSEFIWKNERKKCVNSWIQEFVDEAGRFLDSAQDLWRGRHSSRKWQEVATFFSEQLSIWKMLSSPTNPNSNEKGQWFPAVGDSRSIEKLNTNRSRCRLEVSAHRCRSCTPACPQEVHIQPYTNSMMPFVAARCISIFVCVSSPSLSFHLDPFFPPPDPLDCCSSVDGSLILWRLFVCCLSVAEQSQKHKFGNVDSRHSVASLFNSTEKIACWHVHPPLIRRQVSKWSVGSSSNDHWKKKGVHARKRFLWRMNIFYLHLFFFLRARGNANCEHIANLRRYMLQASAIAWHRHERVFLQWSWKRSFSLKSQERGRTRHCPSWSWAMLPEVCWTVRWAWAVQK